MVTTSHQEKLSERFEVAFNRIHEVLRKIVNANTDRFSKLVSIGARNRQVIELYEDELLQYAKLRNSMVHYKTGLGYYIAEPHRNIVERIEKIAEVMSKPNYALTIASKPVCYDVEDTIHEVIQGIRQYSYSQFPIYNKGECVGLLKTGTITKWMAENVVNSIVNLVDIKVNDVFQYEKEHPLAFAPKSTDIFEIEEIYEKAHQSKRDLEAVIITENGKQDETPLGIVTAWDLIEIDYTTD